MFKQFIPIDFKESNNTLRGFRDVKPLRVYSDGKVLLSCWKIPFMERIRCLFIGKVFVCCMGQTQPPMWLSTIGIVRKRRK